MIRIKIYFPLVISLILLVSCKSTRIPEEPVKTILEANIDGKGPALVLDFTRGEQHNHPSFVLWAEDMQGSYLQTLFISRSIGTGVFEHGDPSGGTWKPGEIRRPASLPYWAHKRGVKDEDGLYVPSSDNPVADAYTGATPSGDFQVNARFDGEAPRKFRIMFEINQTWDWNEFWTNNKYPDDDEYKTSCQPALVYMAEIDRDNPKEYYELKVIGHSHYSGKTGELFTDLGTMTTALEIADKLVVRLVE